MRAPPTLLGSALVLLTAMPILAADKFEFRDGDRVVLIGGTMIEREQRYGYWEAALIAAHPDKNIILRNLGWSGDTVWGEARAGFDSPAEGFKRLVSLTLDLKPTVIIVNYGANECFASEAGLRKFEQGFEKLLDALKPAKARIALLLPLPFEFGPAAKHNADLKKYSEVIRKIGAKRELFVADVGEHIARRQAHSPAGSPPLTDNGMHLTAIGYKFTDEDFLLAFGVKPWEGGPDNLMRWRSRDAEPLRKAIIEKNQLFFHRWRPQNVTYLFGFRKHEQGNNAVEIPQFDPLVAAKEKEIAKLRKPVEHVYELVPVKK